MNRNNIRTTSRIINQSFLLFITLFFSIETSQAQFVCGEFHQEKVIQEEGKHYLQDRFGNVYSKEEVDKYMVNPSTYKTPINTGYFNLNFNNFPEMISTPGHPNFGDDLRPVICQVFSDLSNMIVQRSYEYDCGDEENPYTVNLYINTDVCGTQDGCNNASSNVAGVASPFFSDYFNISGIKCNTVYESNIWYKINGKAINFQVLTDGRMAINVDNINIHYGLDLDNPPAADKIDLYSVVLHEALHLLGFASKVSEDGSPSSESYLAYTRWDQNLRTTDLFDPNNPSIDTERLLSTDCSTNCFEIKDDITDFESLADNLCNNSGFDIVFGDNHQAPIYGTNNGELNIANGLSHLRESCNGNTDDYVSDPFISNGDDERIISQTELSILCKLGYKLEGDNLPEDCESCFAYAVVDHDIYVNYPDKLNYYETCCYEPFLAKINETKVFDFDALLCNDQGGDNIEISDIFFYDDFWFGATLTNISGNTYEFKALQKGIYFVYYTIKNCDCYMSTGFLQIVVSSGKGDCERTNCENQICIGDFEEYDIVGDLFLETCYEDMFLLEGTYQNTPNLCYINNNKISNLVNNGIGPEAHLLPLANPIEKGCTFTLSVDLQEALIVANNPGLLNIYGSEYPPCHPSKTYTSTDCNEPGNVSIIDDCDDFQYIPFCFIREKVIDHYSNGTICPEEGFTMEHYSWTFTNNTEYPINYLMMYNSSVSSIIWLDNLDLRISCLPEIEFSTVNTEATIDIEELVEVEVCLSDDFPESFTSTNIEIEATLPAGFSFGTGGDFVGGIAVAQDLEAGECKTLYLSVIGAEVGEFNINFKVLEEEWCYNEEYLSEITIKPVVGTQEWTNPKDIPLNSTFYITNLIGQTKKLNIDQYNENQIMDEISNNASGIYFLSVYKNGKLIFSQKLLHIRK